MSSFHPDENDQAHVVVQVATEWRCQGSGHEIERQATGPKVVDSSAGNASEWAHRLLSQGNCTWPPQLFPSNEYMFALQYFGNVEVSQPKGIEVVKESINKLKFIQPIKKAEGSKIPKVELTISVNGVAIQEPKSKKIYCQFPLHRISYCADDKTEKKFFSFIAKDVDTEKHLCFVFMSEKMSEEIILTIGQAFDLAYAKFIETSGRELEIRKQLIILQKKVCHLEEENQKLKERISKYEPSEKEEEEKGASSKENGTASNTVSTEKSSKTVAVPALQPPPSARMRNCSSNQGQINLLDADLECQDSTMTIANQPLINDLLDQDFNPRALDKVEAPVVVPSTDSMAITQEKDIFGCEPFQVQDPFGMGQFSSGDLDSAIDSLDKKLAEMRVSHLQTHLGQSNSH